MTPEQYKKKSDKFDPQITSLVNELPVLLTYTAKLNFLDKLTKLLKEKEKDNESNSANQQPETQKQLQQPEIQAESGKSID